MKEEVNRPDGKAESITVKCFKAGHMFMLADSFHSMVEKGIKKKKKLQNFQDLVNVVNEKGEAVGIILCNVIYNVTIYVILFIF